MSIISLYIPDDSVDRIFDAIANNYNYTEFINFSDENMNFIQVSNPETKSQFTNRIIREFLADHLRTYEMEKARIEAEQLAQNSATVIIGDGSTASVYNYHMVCIEPAKNQYDGLASIIAPGNSFNMPLSTSGELPATHYGLEVGITETARQQLFVLELSGGTSTGGVQTLFYVRCDPQTNIAQSTNIDGYDIIGQECSMSKLIEYLGLKVC